jgi:antitoxin ParD1/3/4
MATVRKTVTFTQQQDNWIKSQINAGKYTNDSEYLRDLVRRDQAKKGKFNTLKSAIQTGLDSGISEKSIPDIMNEVEKRLRADGRL